MSGAFDFGPYLGIDGVADGVGDLNRVLGQTGTFAAGMNFAYAGENVYVDQLAPIQAGFALFRNNSPSYVCGVASHQVICRTAGTSFEFAGLTDGDAPSTRASGRRLNPSPARARRRCATAWRPGPTSFRSTRASWS